MTTIRLPARPANQDYEDFLTASLTALGYFTETRLKLRKGTLEIGELDIVASPVGEGASDRILFEAKSGKSGYSDLFKVFGQKTYLKMCSACIALTDGAGGVVNSEHIKRLMDEMGVKQCIYSPKEELTSLADARTSVGDKLRHRVALTVWWHGTALRIAQAQFVHFCKSSSSSEHADAAYEYHKAIEDAFFQKTSLKRVEALYRAYQASPNLTGNLINELAGQPNTNDTFRELENSSEHLWLQYFMLLEHRARICIIKNALDHSVGEEPSKGTIRVGDKKFSYSLISLLPRTFQAGLKDLQDWKWADRLPYLLQVFIQCFGGFYFATQEELKIMSEITGIPANEIVNGLTFLQKFFPCDKGWFYQQPDDLVRMRFIPALSLGTGCFFRQYAYDCDNYEARYPKMGWLMSKWHNAVFAILKEHLEVKKEK